MFLDPSLLKSFQKRYDLPGIILSLGFVAQGAITGFELDGLTSKGVSRGVLGFILLVGTGLGNEGTGLGKLIPNPGMEPEIKKQY